MCFPCNALTVVTHPLDTNPGSVVVYFHLFYTKPTQPELSHPELSRADSMKTLIDHMGWDNYASPADCPTLEGGIIHPTLGGGISNPTLGGWIIKHTLGGLILLWGWGGVINPTSGGGIINPTLGWDN